VARLEEYHKKRDFRRTPEPAGQSPGVREKEEGLFVVHKHDARRLHYDLRLEHEGVLESWAVPKGPALKAGEKRLAVRVEDHPLEYGDFEGVIPEGEYGAGTVMLWDRGRVRVQRRSDDRLDFVLEGHKLLGTWSLVRMSPRAAEDGDNWLLIKRRERTARRDRRVARAVAGLADLSVVSGRTMEQIATDRDRTWTSTGEADSDDSAPDPEAITAARRAPLPRNPRPQLATLAPAAPEGDGWLHEIKFDGYRIMARLEHGSVRLLSRNGKDWTNRFPAVAALLTGLPVTDVLLDGEMVALGKDGGSSFRHLQEALSAGRTQSLVYQVFDLLHLDGFDLGGVPLTERKRALTRLLESAGMVGSSRVRYTDHLEGQGPAFFEQVCRLGLEGIISKRSDKDYREGRSRHWLKVKCTRHEELLIGGYTEPRGARSAFGALLLGAWQGSRLVYAGKVGTGFSERQLETLLRELRALEVPDSPFDPPPDERGVHWVRPMLVAEVEYSEWTRDGRLRHPTFRGLREDREPEEIRLPEGAPAVGVAAAPASGGSSRREEAEVAGVRLSNPDRVLYPQQGVTKRGHRRLDTAAARRAPAVPATLSTGAAEAVFLPEAPARGDGQSPAGGDC
jgi:bifunctional non-homologous end joining protein LigD